MRVWINVLIGLPLMLIARAISNDWYCGFMTGVIYSVVVDLFHNYHKNKIKNQ